MKFWNYWMITLGISILLFLSGNDAFANSLNFFGITAEGINFSVIASRLAIIIAAGTGATIIAAALGRTASDNIIFKVPLLAFFAGTMLAMWGAIISSAPDGMFKWVVYLIGAIMGIGYFISSVEFLGGTD